MSAHQLISRSTQRRWSSNALSVTPPLRTIIVSCVDHRADPSHVFDLQPGEAAVIRNAGGRITQAVLHDLAILATVAAIENMGTDFELVVMHHTDCGTSRLHGPAYEPLLAGFFGVAPSDVAARRVDDPYGSIEYDVDLLRTHPLIPTTLRIFGMVLDVASGVARLAVPLTAPDRG